MSRTSHEPPDAHSHFITSLPSPPQTPGVRTSARKASFSFGSPFALLGGKGKDKPRRGTIVQGEGEEDASGARRKRLPSGYVASLCTMHICAPTDAERGRGIVLIKGPFPQADYLPFSPPPEEVPSLPPLPANLAQLKAATLHKYPSPAHRRSLSGFRGAQPAPGTASGVGGARGSLDPPPEALLSKSLPEDGLLASTPDFSLLSLALPRSVGRSRAGSLAAPQQVQMYAPPRASIGSRRPSIGASPPPRPPPPPPPPHLGLGALNMLKNKPFRPLSKSNPNTPLHELPDPFLAISLTQALANPPPPLPKGPALRAVERADQRMSLSGELRPGELQTLQNLHTPENPLVRLPSAVFRETQPLRVSPKSSPQAKVLELPARRVGEKKDTVLQKSAVILPQGPALPPKAEVKKTLPDRPRTSPTVSQALPMSEKEKKIRSVLGLTFPHPPTPLLPYATADGPVQENTNSEGKKDMNADSPIIVPDMPKTPPMQQHPTSSPRTSPDRTVKAKRSMIIFRSDSWKQHKRKRSQSIAGSPASSWSNSTDTAPPLPTSPQKDKLERNADVPLSPSLSPREYALAHAQAHNEAQAQAMRKVSSPTVSPGGRLHSSPSKRVGELEEENKLLREALKAHREKLHVTLRQSTDRGPRPLTPPSTNAQLQQPAHILEGPPAVPLPPTPASPLKMLAVPASPNRHKLPYPMLRAVGSSASIASLATGTSSTSSFSNSRATTPQSPSRRETGTLFAEITSLQTQLAQAQGEIEVYKLLTTNTTLTKSPGENLKNAMKKCRSEPMLAAMVGLGIDAVVDLDEDTDGSAA
ncbi:hypothetical protein CALVIDRAFT_403510 [Calocera viscosa TUFC12733]|uniref:Uncharacterized protein n=1 Tax=Calocera viscosa (strain TUFC12733) TaxID=1330018 RepID=A0A167PTV6_CALVF|nr:hypothetical protein CALVIDRAFT_403510 [Calocera viscosa TUFC12733]